MRPAATRRRCLPLADRNDHGNPRENDNPRGRDRPLRPTAAARAVIAFLPLVALAPGCKGVEAVHEKCVQQCSTISELPWFSTLKGFRDAGYESPPEELDKYFTDCVGQCKKYPKVTECFTRARHGCDAAVCMGGQDPGVCSP